MPTWAPPLSSCSFNRLRSTCHICCAGCKGASCFNQPRAPILNQHRAAPPLDSSLIASTIRNTPLTAHPPVALHAQHSPCMHWPTGKM
jgi:hypothetical protein